MSRAEGKRVAILATDGFEQSELESPKTAIEDAGGEAIVVSPNAESIVANQHREHGDTFAVDVKLSDANPDDFHSLLIPGGLFNPDALRINEEALEFVIAFFERKKPVFSICHGPQVLISADLVRGRKMTGFKAIQRDLENAGAIVRDEAVVVDDGLVTSRNPDDLDAFNEILLEELCEGRHEDQDRSVAA